MEAVRRGGGALALLFLLLTPTLANAAHEDAPHPQPHPSKCLRSLDRPPPQRHVFFSGERLPLRLETSRRLTHRLAAQLLRIFLAEVLGYARVEVALAPSPYGAGLRLAGHLSDSWFNHTMVNPEVWVPPESDADIFAKSCGSISFPGRYGWFIPTTLFNASAGMGSWRFFKDPVQAQKFELTEDDFNYVKDIAIKSARSECADGQCNSWIYVPPWCNASDGSVLSPCATLLAGYQEETSFAKEDIEKLHLYVQIVWLGAHLANTTYDLMKRYHERSVSGSINHSLVVLVGVPDELIVAPNDEFRAIAMPQCNPSCNKSHDDCIQKCNYEMQRLVKLVWPALPASAKPAYEAIDEMTLDYAELLTLYRVYQNVEQTACAWMQKNEPIWEKWKKTGKNKLSIGGIFPITGSSHMYHGIVRAAEMALEAVNRNDSLLPDYNLSLKVNDGKCAADVVMKTFIDYVMDDLFRNLVGILGPACSDTVEPLAGITRHFRTVVISYSAEGASFSDRKKYPYFFRTIGENKQYSHVYVHILKELGWKRVAALTEDGQKYTEYVASLHDALHNTGTFVYNRKFPKEREPGAMRKYLEDIKLKNIRIIIGDVYDQAARDVMCHAYKMEMTAQQGYVWFLPSWLSPDWFDTSRNTSTSTNFRSDSSYVVNCTTEEMLKAIDGHLQLTHAYFAPNASIMQEGITVGDWREQYREVCKKKGVTPSNYAGYAYDAVWTYAYALDKLARENQTYLIEIHSDTTTRRFVEVLQNTNFDGVSGNIQFINGGPSRVTTIHVLQWLRKTTHIVGTFPPPIDDKWCCLNASKIVWLTPKGVKPEDGTEEPIGCVLASLAKLMNGNCEAAIIVANVIGFGLLGIFLIIGFLVVKRRYEHKVRQTENYMKSLGIDLLVASDLDKWEIPRDHVVINRKLGEGAFGTVYGGEAHFPEKGWVAVAVKTLKVGSTTEEKLDFLSEAEVMKRFEHKNVVKLLGVCTKNEPVYTVMEFMLYGDLKTYLLARRHLVNERLSEESDDISSKKLTSMALDVARALSYLAELKYVHRDVASRNCLVNAARTVKLGDFGMTRPMFENDYYKFNRKGMLPVRWMSPESLALGIFTPASDIWSFGVLLYEVITFGSFPFQGMSNNEVLDYVKEGYTLKVPKGIKPQLEGLIYSCWNKDYKARPHASEIVEFIANNPRLITPNLDVPASAVQPEEGGGGLGLPVRRRRSSAPSDGSAAGYPNRNMGSPCMLPPLLGDGEFSATLQDVGNEELLVGCVHEPLLRPPNANTGPALGLGLTKYASLQHDSDEYCTQDTPNAVSML